MNRFIQISLALLIGLVACTSTSCKHEGEYDHSDVVFFYSCSQDILEYFTYKIYVENGNNKHEITLSKNDFQESYTVNDTLASGVVIKKSIYVCEITERLDGKAGDFEASVVHIPNFSDKDFLYDKSKPFLRDGIVKCGIMVYCQEDHRIEVFQKDFPGIIQEIENSNEGFKDFIDFFANRTSVLKLTYNIDVLNDKIVFDGDCSVGYGYIDATPSL